MDAQDHGTVPGLAAPELAHQDVVDLAPLGTTAAHAVVTPTSERAPDAANVSGPVQTETQCLIFKHHADDCKRFAVLRAHLALNGYSLSRTAASDGPLTGAAAAQSLKAQTIRSGLVVAVMTPTTPGADWCGLWTQCAAVSVATSEAAT
jgi:hypothetical protein